MPYFFAFILSYQESKSVLILWLNTLLAFYKIW